MVPPSGERRGSRSSQKAVSSRPVVSRSGAAPGASRSSRYTSDVSRSSTNTARRPSAPTVRDRGRSVAAIASSRQCGGGSRSLRGGTGIPCRSSLPIQICSSGSGTRRSFLDPGERLAPQGADRGQVVAAVLDEDGGDAEGAGRAARGAEPGRGDGERRLRVVAGGVDAERGDEGARAAVAHPSREALDRADPRFAAAARRERPVAV